MKTPTILTIDQIKELDDISLESNIKEFKEFNWSISFNQEYDDYLDLLLDERKLRKSIMKPENILLAEFDGRVFKAWNDNASYNKEFNTFQECKDWLDEIGNELHKPALGWDDVGQAYETNWNRLMGVVEKIESMGFCVDIKNNICTISRRFFNSDIEEDQHIVDFWNQYNNTTFRCDTKKEVVYNSVVSFVEEYNKFRKSN